MKRRILSALYNGNLILGEQRRPDSEEYQKLIDQIDCKRKQLTDSEKQKLDELMNLHTEALNCEVEEAFHRGFAAGILLMQEIQTIAL